MFGGQDRHHPVDLMMKETVETAEMMRNLQLDQMLADLREGSVEFDD